jgi:hypothetical protein
MKINGNHKVPYRFEVSNKSAESIETKKIRLLGQRIKEIERETEFIKDNGYKPQSFGKSYFLKKLDSF